MYVLIRARNEEEKTESDSPERCHPMSLLLVGGGRMHRRVVKVVVPVFLLMYTLILSHYYNATADYLFGLPTGEQAVATLIAENDGNGENAGNATSAADTISSDGVKVNMTGNDDLSSETKNTSGQVLVLSEDNETDKQMLTTNEWLNVIPNRLRIYEQKTGVVLFNHIPKTGGSTVRQNFFPDVKEMSVARLDKDKNLTDFDSLRVNFWNVQGGTIVKLMESILSGERRQLLFVELHGDVPGLETLHPEMKKLRKISLETGVPFFAFTLLREPVSFHISYFKAFHNPRCRFSWCEKSNRLPLSDESILKTAVPNKQCYILTHGQYEIKSRDPHSNLTAADCRRAYELLREDYDFVGTMTELSTVGLPLLTSILVGNATAAVGMSRSNVHKSDFKIGDATRSTLLNISGWDVEMYNAIRTGVPPTISG